MTGNDSFWIWLHKCKIYKFFKFYKKIRILEILLNFKKIDSQKRVIWNLKGRFTEYESLNLTSFFNMFYPGNEIYKYIAKIILNKIPGGFFIMLNFFYQNFQEYLISKMHKKLKKKIHWNNSIFIKYIFVDLPLKKIATFVSIIGDLAYDDHKVPHSDVFNCNSRDIDLRKRVGPSSINNQKPLKSASQNCQSGPYKDPLTGSYTDNITDPYKDHLTRNYKDQMTYKDAMTHRNFNGANGISSNHANGSPRNFHYHKMEPNIDDTPTPPPSLVKHGNYQCLFFQWKS